MKTGWIDTHCHLTDDAYRNDRAEILARLEDYKVTACITLGIDIASSYLARNLARLHHRVFFCAGVHPHDSTRIDVTKYGDELCELLSDPKCVALGEIGLDFYRDYAPAEIQVRQFLFQLELAQSLHKPIVIHNRTAEQQIMDALDSAKFTAGGIFHCFSGDRDYARECIDRGFYISFAGNITYENSDLLDVALSVPLDRLLIETDAPWLTPQPLKKQKVTRNEPAFVAHTGSFLADRLGVSVDELQRQLFINTLRAFHLDFSEPLTNGTGL